MNNTERIDNLTKQIENNKIKNNNLKMQEIDLQEQTLRYQKIFNKSYLSIWEEDPAEVYKILATLPCKTGIQLSKYLRTNTEVLIGMITNLKIKEINSYTVSLFGAYDKTHFLQTLNEGKILTPEAFPGFVEIFASMIDKKSYCKTEISTYKVDGTKLELLVTAFLPGKEQGNVIFSMMDITTRKDKEDGLSNSITITSEQKNRSEVLQNILLTLTSSLEKEQILNTILLGANKIVPYAAANIRLLDSEKLKVVASVGYDKFGANEFITNSSINIMDFGDANKFLNTDTISIIADTQKYPNWTTFPETSFIRGHIGIPFKLHGKVSGLISLDSDKTDAFSESDIEKLKPFVDTVTVALESSYLFETRKKELEKRKTIEVSLTKSLNEKEFLLKEIHHRVKNNLALIMSLINLQSNMVPDKIDPVIFEDLKQRVYTISLVHEMLYKSNNLSTVDFNSYINNLIDSVSESSFFKEGIKFKTNIGKDIVIDSDTLVPLALMINELIVNSIKHAFPVDPGTISIEANMVKNDYKIILKDDGIGFPEKRKISSSILGLDLVESMVAQINGSIEFKNESGAVTTIIFPREKKLQTKSRSRYE